MCTSTTTNLVGFFMQKRYILTAYYDSFMFNHISQTIAMSNNFDELHIIFENLLVFIDTMDIYDCKTNELILKSSDYAPPKQK